MKRMKRNNEINSNGTNHDQTTPKKADSNKTNSITTKPTIKEPTTNDSWKIIPSKTDSIKRNYHISQKYILELENIRNQVKNGQCNKLNECLLLFEELWHDKNPYNIILSHNFQKEMDKLSQKDPEQFKYVLKKMDQIRTKPLHYKPLSGDLHGARRAHVGDSVLIFQLESNMLFFHDYNHHDQVYK